MYIHVVDQDQAITPGLEPITDGQGNPLFFLYQPFTDSYKAGGSSALLLSSERAGGTSQRTHGTPIG